MTEQNQKQLGKTLWAIADQLRGAMNADDFRDYMLAFLFLRYLSDNYQQAAKKELGRDYPDPNAIGNGWRSSLSVWYEQNPDDVSAFEKQMRLKAHYVIRPKHLWASIAHMARTQDGELLNTLQTGFKYIENESFQSTFSGLFSEINLASDKLGKTYADRNAKLCTIITKIAEGLAEFSTDSDSLGDAYEYLIGQFAAGSGKKAGEFYTPQRISDILSAIVALDSQEPKTGKRKHLARVMDFACGSGSLLLNVRKRMGPHGIGKIYGQEKNVTTYNLARMNMLLHGVKDSEFEIYHGDTLTNDWDLLRETNPAKKPHFDAVVANPPFSYRWGPNEALGEDVRFKNYGMAPKSAADFAFPATRVSLPQGRRCDGDHPAARRAVPRRRGGERFAASSLPTGTSTPSSASRRICSTRPASRSASSSSRSARSPMMSCSSTPPSISRRASGRHYLSDEHIEKIIDTYQQRPESIERYARRVEINEIEANDCNLNISRYVSTAEQEVEIDLSVTHKELVEIEKQIQESTAKHNAFLKELGLSPLPAPNK